MNKKDLVQTSVFTSLFNQPIPKDKPLYFDSFEKSDDNNHCYITTKIGGGFHWMVKAEWLTVVK